MALQDTCKGDAHQDTQKGIGKAGKNAGKSLTLLQWGHSIAHSGHAEHQYGKAHENVADSQRGLLFSGHAQDDADNGNNARKGGGA